MHPNALALPPPCSADRPTARPTARSPAGASLGSRAVLGFCAALLVGTAMNAAADTAIDTQRPDAPELAAYGDYNAGVRAVELVNPDQLDVLALDASGERPDPLPLYDRPLTVQVWYPANPTAIGSQRLSSTLRDGQTPIKLTGRSVQFAAPLSGEGAFPLVIISHGYPGNRFLLSHLADNLASKGYVVASIDHTDSTYRTQAAFGSTLRNRTLDHLFVLDEMQRLNADSTSFLEGLVDTSRTAIVGYSMGGYGALITAGSGVTSASLDFPFSPPFRTLDIHEAGSESEADRPDPRILTAVAIAPWGRQIGFFDADTLAGIGMPVLYIAGDEDDVSGYEDGVRAAYLDTVNVDAALLSFENANHNAAAPHPAPAQSFQISPNLGRPVFDHYADAVWDTTRMNNIAQHFVTAWLGKYLKDEDTERYLDLVERADDGVFEQDENGNPTEANTYWAGFPDRSAKGLRFERRAAAR